MDWLAQYWPYLLAVLLIGLLAVRLVTTLPRFRQPTRHSGERMIRVIGVGGAGGNAINHMIRAKQRGVEYVAVNTDAQVLDESLAMRRVQIGAQLTQGLGAGGDATIGREAAVEDEAELARMVAGSDLVFIAAGLGGGTGSGAAPVIAKKAREAGALTVGVVTMPFTFEGAGRRKVADEAEAELKANVDTLLLIQNEKVMDMVGEDTSMLEAFRVVNEVLARTVRAIVDVMTVPGLINLDFADVRSVMRNGGTATTGIGWASGPDRAVEAARGAVNNPLLDHDISGAGAILLNVAGASTMSMREVTRAADEIRNAADPEASIIFGTIFDDSLGDELRVTVIATRFNDRPERPLPVAVPVAAAVPDVPVATEPTAPIAPPVFEEQQPVEAAAAFAPVTTWQHAATEPEPSFEPEPAFEPEAAFEPAASFEPEAAFEPAASFEPEPASEPEPALEPEPAFQPAPEPIAFHVAPQDDDAPVTPWYMSGPPATSEAPVAPEAEATSEQPMSSSVATVLAALADEPAPSSEEEEQTNAAFEQHEAPAPTYYQPEAEAPAPTYYQAEPEAAAPRYDQHEQPTAAYEQHEMPAEPHASEPDEQAPALPHALAEILRDEPEPVSSQAPEPQPSEPPASIPSPVAPSTSTPAQSPGPQRQEPIRTPTSALVGRFWSRVGKSQR